MLIRWPILSLIALLLFTARGSATAQTGPSLFIDPTAQTAPLDGDTFEVRIMVDDVTTEQGLGGYTLVMNYDPSIVQARTITDSGFVGSTDNAVICPASAIDNDAGRLAHFCFTISIFSQPGPQTSEPQVLVTVTFDPVGEGATTLDISETTITDALGNVLAVTTSNGEVTVEQGATAPAPTATAGPPATGATGADANGLPTLGSGLARGSTGSGQYTVLGFLTFGIAAVVGATLLARRRRHDDPR